jgi:ABC-2 type transport system permease protein
VNGFVLLLGKEVREQVRTLRLVVVVAVLALFGGTSPLLAKLLPEIVKAAGSQAGGLTITIPTPTTADAVSQLVKNLGQFGALIAILVAMGSVATEKERGTAGFILTKPVGRDAFIAAKAASIALLLLLGVLAGYVVAWFYTAVLFETLAPVTYIAGGIVLWVSLLVIGGITFLASVLARSALVAGGVGFVALILTGILSAIPGIGPFMPSALWAPATLISLGTPAPDVLGPVLVNVAIAALCVVGAALAFRRQEL